MTINTKQLSHLASNVIIEIAKIYNCSEIYVEWLKGLKSKKYGKDLNWKINSTVRQKIYEKVGYKARLNGIEFKKPVNPNYTSQYCPRCGRKGHHCKASDRRDEVSESGSWFVCDYCEYNADRDYVAVLNLARKVLFGEELSEIGETSRRDVCTKAIVYKAVAISDKLFRQSRLRYDRLFHCLNGWRRGSKF